MTERELRKLSRTDLLEMLLEQSRDNEKLQIALEEANEKLADRTLKIDKAGSLAEASLQLNGLFEAAEAACLQYSENIKLLSMRQEHICAQLELETKVKCEQLEKDTAEKCSRLEKATNEKCFRLEQEMNTKCEKLERETEEKCTRLNLETEGRCALLNKETEEKCQQRENAMKEKCAKMLETAKQESEAYWTEVSGKIQEFTKSYADLQKLWERSPFSSNKE